MTIDELKKLRKYVDDHEPLQDPSDQIITLIDNEIERQEHTTPSIEEINRVIGWMIGMREKAR